MLADGTDVILSTASKDDQLYIAVNKFGWNSISERKSYPIRVQFGTVDQVEDGFGSAATQYTGPGIGLFLDGSPRAYTDVLRKSATLTLSVEGNSVATVSLAGTGKALNYLDQCTAMIKGGGKDPFAESANTLDPFKSK